MRRLSLGLAILAVTLWTGAYRVEPSAAQTPKQTTAHARPNPANPGDFAGAATCETCHAEIFKKFSDNPHSKLALQHSGKGVTCESCHGAGKAHVESGGDKSRILDLASASPTRVDETCLGCHAGAHPNFLRSLHAKANVSCTGCHTVHDSAPDTVLLKANQPTLCYQCHADVKPAFAATFHHKVDEGLMKCSDCHETHGTFGNNQVKSTADQNAVCVKCHAETGGPFVYEHAPVKAEGCVGCHAPHGSQNARLLNITNVNTLCKQCHSVIAAGTVHGMSGGSSELTPCIICHTMIHGSNLNQAFLK